MPDDVRMFRKHGPMVYAQRIVRDILKHPVAGRQPYRSLARAASWQLWKRLVDRPLDIELPTGLLLRCHADSQSASNVMYFTYLFDANEMAFTWRYLRPGDSYLDVGANIGTYTLLAVAAMEGVGHVDAIEPHPTACQRLRENVALNDLREHVDVHEVAFGREPGTAQLTADADVSNRVATDIPVGRQAVTVSVRTMSEFLERRSYQLAKLDIEGAEMSALAGAQRYLEQGNPGVLQVEILDHLLTRQGSSAKDLTTFLVQCGYEFRKHDEDTRSLYQPDSRQGNLLAVHHTAKKSVSQRLRESSTPPPVRAVPVVRLPGVDASS